MRIKKADLLKLQKWAGLLIILLFSFFYGKENSDFRLLIVMVCLFVLSILSAPVMRRYEENKLKNKARILRYSNEAGQ